MVLYSESLWQSPHLSADDRSHFTNAPMNASCFIQCPWHSPPLSPAAEEGFGFWVDSCNDGLNFLFSNNRFKYFPDSSYDYIFCILLVKCQPTTSRPASYVQKRTLTVCLVGAALLWPSPVPEAVLMTALCREAFQ